MQKHHLRNPDLLEVVDEQRCKRCRSNGWRCFIETDPNSPRRVCRPCGKNKCSFGNRPERPATKTPLWAKDMYARNLSPDDPHIDKRAKVEPRAYDYEYAPQHVYDYYRGEREEWPRVHLPGVDSFAPRVTFGNGAKWPYKRERSLSWSTLGRPHPGQYTGYSHGSTAPPSMAAYDAPSTPPSSACTDESSVLHTPISYREGSLELLADASLHHSADTRREHTPLYEYFEKQAKPASVGFTRHIVPYRRRAERVADASVIPRAMPHGASHHIPFAFNSHDLTDDRRFLDLVYSLVQNVSPANRYMVLTSLVAGTKSHQAYSPHL